LSQQKHIVLISSFLNFVGGYERIVASFVNLLAEKGENITLLLLADTDESFYPLDKKVRVVQLPLHFGITPKGNMITRKMQMLKDLLLLRKTLRQLKPSFLICSEYHYAVAGVLTAERKKTKVFSWEHTHYNVNFKNRFWRVLCNIIYPKLDGIICLNPDEKKLFSHLNKNVVVIPNFIHLPDRRAPLQNKAILTIARLTAVKGIDHLLEIAKLVLTKHPDWKWKVIGEGELQSAAENFIKKENLEAKLLLQAPSNHNIAAEYESASMYVMTSANECFPMVLLEALSYGLPCISFDVDTGPRHIIQNNIDGLLVKKDDLRAMVNAIDSMIGDEEKQKRMAENAVAGSIRFSPEVVYQLWKNLFNEN
jgi:glycosyltransferase involved in cell wall biosynthesis